MPPLKAGNPEFVLARLAGTIDSGQSRGAIRRAASNFGHIHQPLLSVGGADDDHPMMQQGHMETDECGLVTAVLRCGARKSAPHFADQRTVCPQPAGLVEKVPHLSGHVAEPGWSAENDRVSFSQLCR